MKITNTIYPNFNLANEEDRGENLIIDFVISSFFALLLAFVTFKTYAIALLVYISVRFFYYFFFELLLGRTPGKYQTQTRVVNKNGNQPTAFQLIIRTFSRVISILSGISDDERAVHDSLSNTFVIKNTELSKIEIRQPLILIFNQSILGLCIYGLLEGYELDTLSSIALILLVSAFISNLIFGIKKIRSSTSPKHPSTALKEPSVKP